MSANAHRLTWSECPRKRRTKGSAAAVFQIYKNICNHKKFVKAESIGDACTTCISAQFGDFNQATLNHSQGTSTLFKVDTFVTTSDAHKTNASFVPDLVAGAGAASTASWTMLQQTAPCFFWEIQNPPDRKTVTADLPPTNGRRRTTRETCCHRSTPRPTLANPRDAPLGRAPSF